MKTIKLADGGIRHFDTKVGTMQQFWKHEAPSVGENAGQRINFKYQKIVKG